MEMLDQGDIDALLAAAAAEDDQPEEAVAQLFSRRATDLEAVEIRGYDFKRPERVSKDQMRALQTLHESFARNFGASLSSYLRTIVEVKVATCEQMTYAEFISGLPNPTSFNLIETEGLEGQICLEISPLIIYPVIDRLLGGNNHDLFVPQRPMTLIESRLISSVTTRGLTALSEAWSGVRDLSFEVTATESNPQLVQIVPPNEVVVVVGLEIKMSNRAGTMNLCIPYNVIEPVMEQLSSQSWFSAGRKNASAAHAKRLRSELGRARIEVSALLARTTISVEDLRTLSKGDLIVTDRSAAAPSVLMAEGEPKFLVQLGQHRGMRAMQVIRGVSVNDRI